MQETQPNDAGVPASPSRARGLAEWILARFPRAARPRPRLRLLERIALAPRQSLALVEAEGRRLLVATSSEGAPAFYPLDGPAPFDTDSPLDRPASGHTPDAHRVSHRRASNAHPQPAARVSW